jgi:16S rRNA (cytosine967-C5)-methyltransferase
MFCNFVFLYKKLKFHKILIEGAIETLQNIFQGQQYADQALQRMFFKQKKWGARDRGFVAETVYDITRYHRLYSHLLHKEPHSKADWWKIVGLYFAGKGQALPSWTEWSALPIMPLPSSLPRAVRESIPDWLDQKGLESFSPDLWETTLSTLNTPAHLYIRVNTLRMGAVELEKAFEEEGIHFEKVGEVCYKLGRAHVFKSKIFHKGGFEVQDISSQQVAPYLEVEPGMRVIDACAGAGGKSLHLATLMQNKGTLISMDIENWKLEELKKRAKRNGIHNIQTQVIENSKAIKRLKNSADRLLLDVPCSGMGVLRRNPDAKWKMNPEKVENLIQTQRTLLQEYSEMLRPGGLMVYATCSILKQENQDAIQEFLKDHSQSFACIDQKILLPQELDGDGFFMAKLLKKA